MIPTMPRNRERGGAMMVTLIVIAVLMAGASMLVSIEVNATRSTGLARANINASFCAEAGLAGARMAVANGYGNWAGSICANPDHNLCTEPTWIQSSFVHDLDGDTVIDVKILLVDNDDELINGGTNNQAVDDDRKIYIVSKCIAFPDAQIEVSELVEVQGGGSCTESQKGKGTGFGNSCN